MPATSEIYRRPLPGGGYTAIQLTSWRTLWGRTGFRGRIIVERRALESRRSGHAPPVVIESRHRDRDLLLHELFPIALSNTALAAACVARRRWRNAGHWPRWRE